MFAYEIKIRTRYAEIDRMGFVYYGNYAQYFEVARVEAMRSLGFNYKNFEDNGLIMPVLDFSVRYFKAAMYDEELTVKLFIKELPRLRIYFDYETYNSNNELLNTARTTLVFTDKKRLKPLRPPTEFVKALEQYFNS